MSEILECTGGVLKNSSGKERIISLSTDTRSLKKGNAFLALSGENFDGHNFINEAISNGATTLIVQKNRKPDFNLPSVLVEDTLVALGDIAHCLRKKINPKVVAISGSSGKTTTKDMIRTVISKKMSGLVTKGNFNNLVGLPLTLLRLEEKHKIAVVEFGMNTPGELSRLAAIAQPDIAVMTNIGDAHVGKFANEEELVLAKGELFKSLKKEGIAVINRDCPKTAKILSLLNKGQRIFSFGIENKSDVMAKDIKELIPFGYEFEIVTESGSFKTRLQMFGRYNIYNALCAVAVLNTLDVSIEEISRELKNFRPTQMRGEIEETNGILFVKDYYNANPTSTIETIRSLLDIKKQGKRYAILGDMLELGKFAESKHKEVATKIDSLGFDGVFTLGELGKIIFHTLKNTNKKHFENFESAAEEIAQKLGTGDTVLIKASREMKLEHLFEKIKEHL